IPNFKKNINILNKTIIKMKISVIISKVDIAGMNILQSLQEKGYQDSIVIKEETITSENIDKTERLKDTDLIIFATRHQSQNPIPSLSVHTPGNWSEDSSHGGSPNKLCIAPALYLREAFLKLGELNESYNLNFDVVFECSHHGPYTEIPTMFIEIGSVEKQWKNKDAANIIADTILHLLQIEPKIVPTVFGIGGQHTTSNFKKLITNHNLALGHVCPKYMLEHLTELSIKQAIEKTIPNNSIQVILDWKGLGPHKEKITTMLNNLKIEYKRTKEF
ncbi:D-aminoacyl-tRNA deacylase, partial [Nanoarchaeota archaeon]